MPTTKNSAKGFTVVELLIVIVVISILVAISTVAYRGVQERALNATRINELRSWVQIFDIYKARKGIYPRQNDAVNSGACLGTGFPDGSDGQPRCRELTVNPGYSYTESESEGLMNDLLSVAKVPPADKTPVNGWIVGPWVEFRPVAEDGDVARINITTAIESNDGHECIDAGFAAPYSADDMWMCSAQIEY